MEILSVSEFIESIDVLTKEIQELYCSDELPWIVGYSGGKDSTATLQLIWNAIAQLSPDRKKKPIYIISTDTLIENPYISAWVRRSHQKIVQSAGINGLPFIPNLLNPEISDTYWVGLIGHGYAAPRELFRWCTDKLKIKPSNKFIKEYSRWGSILVLGTRKAESVSRAKTMLKYEKNRVRDRLSPNGSQPSSVIYSPIEDWTNNEVWLYLHQFSNPWGHSNKELFELYRSSTADNECPVVVDTSTPSCGSSRFGCFMCTLVKEDRSMNAMIDNNDDLEWLLPLTRLRSLVDPLKEDRNNRDYRRKKGYVQLYTHKVNGVDVTEPIPGPYLKHWREFLLREVLKAQIEIQKNAPSDMKDIEIISMPELIEIDRLWVTEWHEFDRMVPKIYQEVTGKKLPDTPITDHNALDPDCWEVLVEICQNEDDNYFDLISNLLDIQHQHEIESFSRQRRDKKHFYEKLEKCFERYGLSKEVAIAQAHKLKEIKDRFKSYS